MPRQRSVFFEIWVFCVRSRAYLQTACSQHHQTYTWGEALIETFQNHIGFTSIGARGEEFMLFRVKRVFAAELVPLCNSKRQHAALLLCTRLHSESLHWPAPAAAHADALSNLPLSTTIGHAGRCADARATRRSCARHGSGGEVAAAARRHSKATKRRKG